MERTDLSETQWLQHAYEEALDLAVYLKKIILERRFQVGQTLMWDFSSSDRREVTLLCLGSEKSCVADKRGKWWIAHTKDLEENTDASN